VGRWFARNSATVLFATAVVLLIALSSWWFVFLQRAVSAEFVLQAENIDLHSQVLAGRLAPYDGLKPGQLADDPRFVLCSANQIPVADGQQPPVAVHRQAGLLVARHLRDDLWLCTDEGLRDRMLKRRTRRSWMLFGEGLLLSGLLFAVVVMLYRLFRSERLFREEMEIFLRRITHEMKTPIAGIKAVLQTIQMGRVPPDQLNDLAGRALVEAEREEHLIQNLLVAQRLRQTGAELRVDRLNVGELVERLVAGRQAASARAQWSVQRDGEVVASADPVAVRTIIDNLLDNAAKYGEGDVKVTARSAGNEVVVEVQDDGIGFSADEAGQLFEPFVRSKDSNATSHTGTGLGLSISLQLAAAMRGGIEAHSAGEGQGARFSLTLPAWRDESAI
jgi:signal transduction histidine kinase